MPPSRAVVPSPQWENHWKPTKTLKGFQNPDGVTCYRNAILQMLFHLPVFLNWVHLCVQAHVDNQGECLNGKSPDTTADEDTRCKVCLLHDLIDVFWDPKSDKDDFGIAVDDFWDVVYQDWLDGKPQDGDNNDGQQDIPEVINEILEQLAADLPDSFLESLDDIFGIQVLDLKACTGDKGCGNKSSSSDSFDFLTVQFTEDQDTQTLEQSIKNYFDKYPTEDTCTACKTNPLEAELVLTEVPEVLLVHLDRVGERDTASGETEEVRIDSEIKFSEEVIIKKEWLDPGLGAIRKDIKYVLSSVLLRQPKTTEGVHYMAVVKSQDGTWTLAGDAHLSTYKSFKEMVDTRIIRETGHIFAYRRLPLVTRGPGITLKKSLQAAKYSDPEATEDNAKMEIDEAPAQTDDIMDIDACGFTPTPVSAFGPNRVPATLFRPPLKPPTLVQQNEPNGVQRYDETEIELDKKQRGTLEVKFTTNTGVTTLKVHVKGMLWNELNDKAQGRAATGGRPITRSVATSKQASDVLPPKPVKMNSKAVIREKTSSKLVNGKKGQLEKISPRSPGGIVKKDVPKRSVRK